MAYKSEAVKNSVSYISKQPADVEKAVKDEVKRLGGVPSNRTDVLGQFEEQIGIFKGKSFKWLIENGLGYAAWFANSVSSETTTSAPLSVNKQAFKEYLMSFPEGKETIATKVAKRSQKTSPTNVASLLGRSSLSPQAIAYKIGG